MRMSATPEGKIKAMVKRKLAKLPRKYLFMPVQNGMGAPGLDWYCCIEGRFVAIETKVPGKNLTERQEDTKMQIIAAGGIVFVVRTEENADMMIAWILTQIPRG